MDGQVADGAGDGGGDGGEDEDDIDGDDEIKVVIF